MTMAIFDAFKTRHREVSGEIERIGVMPGSDSASYVLRLKGDPETYYVPGTKVPIGARYASLALTAPGDQVRFQSVGNDNQVKSFENLTYKA
ncbi:hypothetical protein [Burkholderia vietnamiensis]|uniref:hypothetical protein n=1 Tax=Burkholderia cepacia complex TaxID=87882 RepID=UPI0015895583|nr:hypothetical protein [Burkholderia vietnamiensis]MCA8228361.1 hypothetical protein [Burkholderia vietnamiensis]